MSDLADRLREDQAMRDRSMTVSERVGLAMELGRRAVALYAEAKGLDEAEARRALRKLAQLGRTPSTCMNR